jgi:pilus assembly protein CpaE
VLNVLVTGSLDQTVISGLRDRQIHASLVDLAEFERFATKTAHAVVVDIRTLPRLPREIVGIRRHFPHAGIVIIGRTLDPSDLLEAMRMGVNEWVVEPLVHDDLAAAIRRVASPVTVAPVGKMFAILGAKGGVGATTVAVNLATSMTIASKEATLLIDMHPSDGDAAVFLGVDPRFSLTDALENIDRLDETYLRSLIATTPSGADLLASSHRAATSAFEVSRLRRLLDLSLTMYRHVIVDCPRMHPAVLDAVDGASQIVVVANQELPALRSATRLVTSLRQRCGPDRVKVALTRFDPKGEISRSDIERALGGSINYQFPNDYRTSVGAIARGEPLIVSNHSRLAGSLSDCARQLSGLHAKKDNKDVAKTGFFSRLGGRR